MTDKQTRPHRRLKGVRSALILGVLVAIIFDYLSFTSRAANSIRTAAAPFRADAVVALTGGGDRLAKAGELAKQFNLPLFISGVNPASPDADVAAAAGLDDAFMTCCVTSGREARTTAENGQEVARWVDETGHETLIVVTSAYHLERALLEMHRWSPDADLHGYPVSSPVIDEKRWWKDTRSTRRMVLEWAKWRIVSLRESLAGRGGPGQKNS